MATFGNSARKSGFGGSSRGPASPGRAISQPPSSSARGGGEKVRSTWTTATTLYDPYHSSMEVQVVAEFYRSALGLKIAPVFAERRGPDDSGSGRKYNHDEAMLVVFDLAEAIVLRAQLQAFLDGDLAEVVVPRLETKRLLFTPAATYYDANHPEAAVHANGLAVSIEEDATDRADARNVVFICRPVFLQLKDGEPEVPIYSELQALMAVIDSYIGNVARVDFGSVRLLEQRENAPAGPSAAMPTRRTGGLGAPAPRTGGGPTAAAAEGGQGGAGAAAPAGGVTSSAASASDIDDVLDDAPNF